jgi:hypothetical protein
VALGVVEMFFVLVPLLVLALLVWGAVRLVRGPAGPSAPRLPARERAWLAGEIAGARWAPAHDEVDGTTRILLRRSYTGLDGRPAVLEDRVFTTFPSDEPAWEARFTEAMADARYRCTVLNAEDSPQ